MRCFVTGATGFLGSHLVRALLERGHEVTILLRPGSNIWRLKGCIAAVGKLEGSLTELPDVECLKGSFDLAFHLAWAGVTAVHRNDPDYSISNVVGTLHLWQKLRQGGCKAFIGLGSQAEYGPFDGILHEEIPARPVTAYGASKVAIGILLRQLCAGADMRFAWVRLFSSYGPGDDPSHLVPSLISALLKGERPLLTAGEQLWDFLYVTDATAALCAIAESGAEGVFNLASGSAGPIRDFVIMVRDAIDPGLALGFGEVPYRSDQIMHLEAEITRLTQATGWVPKVDWREGIRRTVEWHVESLRVSELQSIGLGEVGEN